YAFLLRFECNEHINIERTDRLQVKGRSDCSADGVTFDHAIPLHPIQHVDDVLNLHAASVRLSSSINGKRQGKAEVRRKKDEVFMTPCRNPAVALAHSLTADGSRHE